MNANFLPPTPPLSPGDCALLACLWEVTAAKPGNVYRGADFDDVTFVDFVTSAAAIRHAMDAAVDVGVGMAVLTAIRSTRASVGSNTNLGMVLLMAPLAAVPRDQSIADGLPETLARLSRDDARLVYEAIRLAKPGGLGSVAEADVHSSAPPEITLLEAMRLAADRDLVARQYVTSYDDVWRVAHDIAERTEDHALEDAIVYAYLSLLARTPDTLIVRKCGEEVAAAASRRAASALASGQPGEASYAAAVSDLDFWLRSDGHKRNPGATADVVAASLFLLLRERRIGWPVRFYRRAMNKGQS